MLLKSLASLGVYFISQGNIVFTEKKKAVCYNKVQKGFKPVSVPEIHEKSREGS